MRGSKGCRFGVQLSRLHTTPTKAWSPALLQMRLFLLIHGRVVRLWFEGKQQSLTCRIKKATFVVPSTKQAG